jgi:hypothetical protein
MNGAGSVFGDFGVSHVIVRTAGSRRAELPGWSRSVPGFLRICSASHGLGRVTAASGLSRKVWNADIDGTIG